MTSFDNAPLHYIHPIPLDALITNPEKVLVILRSDAYNLVTLLNVNTNKDDINKNSASR